ncbi:MAG: hypothetical protein K8R56_06620 [Candidatus Eisenbacteria bacterium]|nr:hypothetical protein [Candidatus Eisenbacteria bacterium]
MDATQRRTLAMAAYAIAGILFVFFFARQFLSWATYDDAKNSIDFGIVKFSSRPPFPSDAKSVFLGLVTPILIAAGGRVFSQGRDA